MKTKLEAQLVGVAGEYLVAGEMTLRGMIASISLRNCRGIDIIVSSSDGSRSATIQVKTNSQGSYAWILTLGAGSSVEWITFYLSVVLRTLSVFFARVARAVGGPIACVCVLIAANYFIPESRCSDGWSSPSIGTQGACSHHGGVERYDDLHLLAFCASIFIGWIVHSILRNAFRKASTKRASVALSSVEQASNSPDSRTRPREIWVLWASPKHGWRVDYYDDNLFQMDNFDSLFFKSRDEAIRKAQEEAARFECTVVWHDKANNAVGSRACR